jgi:hypothetical protein
MSFARSLLLPAVFLASSLQANGAQAPAAMPPAEIVARVGAAYAKGLHGIIGMQRHFTTVVDAGVVRHSEQSDSGLLIDDGVFVAAHYYRVTDDGKAFSASQIRRRDDETNAGWTAGKIFFKEPYDPRFIADYQFTSVAPCPDCSSGTIAIAFSSAKHDAQHGAGTMWIETATDRVVKLTYVPYVLPPHATSGSVTETTAEILPGLWYVVRIDETYAGRAFLLHGTGRFTGVFDHFQRFATLAEGETAVQNGTIGALANR